MEPQKAWVTYAALLFGTFIAIEAAAFQAPALPSVTAHFNVDVNLAALIIVLYSLALTVFAPIMGRLGDQHGKRRILVIGMLVFAAAEFAAAWAPTFWFFLTARFFQGIGAACILPGVFAYVSHLFPENKRGLALGILAFTMTFGAATGGLLGGLLIDRFGWPSVYWISGALTLLGLIPVLLLVPDTPSSPAKASFDYRGAVLLFMTIAAFLSLPTWATNFGRESVMTWAIVIVGLSSIVLLWRHSVRRPNPIIDVGILSRARFAMPSAIYWLHMLFMSGIVYSLAFFINNRPGGSAAQFGLVTLFLYGSGLISSPISGKLIDRFDPRYISITALLASLVGTLLFLSIDTATPLSMVIVIACVLGLSIGCNTPAMMKLALGATPPDRMGAGTGLFSMFRDLGSPTGSSLSLAVFGATLAHQVMVAIQRQTEQLGLDPENIALLARAAARRSQVLPAELSLIITEAGLSQEVLLETANAEGLDAALTNSGYLLLAIILAALSICALLIRLPTSERNVASST